MSGCSKLDYDENDFYTKEDIFGEFDRTEGFLNNIYNRLPAGFNSVDGAMRSSASDDAEEIFNGSRVQQFNDGSWSPMNLLDSRWDDSYEAIRAANIFIEEFDIDNFQELEFNNNYENLMIQARLYPYQARFLRAFFYFDLIKRYGGVPLITKPLNLEESNSVEPTSFQGIVDFIVNECNEIIPELPVDYQSIPRRETGRATRGAAMALKSRVLLYAASPLHNPSGNEELWEGAAIAAKAIIDSGYYSLENDYSDVVNNRNSDELIFERRNSNSNWFERSNFPIGYEGAQPGTAPTQNLVDAYDMQSTGLDIEDANSGYDHSKPYEGRDPRLYKTVIFNNSIWKERPVETWIGGVDGLPQERATETGYYLKKQVIERVSLDPNNTTQAIHTWVHFRLGGILLDYAEAMNEAYGPNDPAGMGLTALQAVNKIRSRADMPDFPVELTQEQFRQQLRDERRVELAFEDHRFWDIRRWKIGPSTTEIYGMEIINNNETFDYQRKLVEIRVWDDRMYFYPIPQNEVYLNENLQQNPGW
ncbi:RagB/SusD family nutrient uptake outer membrane protein [Autumnicola musiva]|uniref:RagB/SusD family nutrient uptake outer membrane protein n=1 Tax=Autumnicola musiva TaxID=3075589 RepID=A0ABU3DAF7_9FLAO|nr:RagB/SusD family nutrient uptake outer membrane protein [Zunongwangia sp. F117]MDT0678335.1 RagB/SusD family nutrient uptake outer membrane protein [Zunongwangia sp. F117]